MATISERELEGFTALTLCSPGERLEAVFVPDAGMVGCSLLHRGEELLGQRGGLRAYVKNRSTMGIPLLHPWANRVAAPSFEVAGAHVDLEPVADLVSTDPNGLPIHGLLAGAPDWRVLMHEADGTHAVLEATFDFSAHERMLSAFPFAHELAIRAELAGPTLRVTTTLRATGKVAVPVSFGFHPYLRIPGCARRDWEIQIPVTERLVLDELMLPTGDREPVEIEAGPLGERTFDDGYVATADPLRVGGAGREIAVALESGYPYTQVYAPLDDDVVALEPMTAPTNALVSGSDLPLVSPGDRYEAVFSVTVSG